MKTLRRELNLSQEAVGGQGFVSTPGWIKIENGQRQASEKLIDKVVRWLVSSKYMRPGAATTLREELITLKYLGNRSAFVREMAKTHARKLASANELLAESPAAGKAKRGRPPGTKGKKSVALVAENPAPYKTKRRR